MKQKALQIKRRDNGLRNARRVSVWGAAEALGRLVGLGAAGCWMAPQLAGGQSVIPLDAFDGTNGFVLESDRLSTDLFFGGLGQSVAGAGDVNGDGIDDLIAGSPSESRAYVVFGSSNVGVGRRTVGDLDGSNGFEIDASGYPNDTSYPSAMGGYSVSGLGDLNGDGFDDVAVGIGAARTNLGQVAVIFGGPTFPARLDATALGTNGFVVYSNADSQNEVLQVGKTVSGVGDLNGDGLPDLGIGSGTGSSTNKAWVVFGSTNGFPAELILETLDGTNGFVAESLTGISPSVSRLPAPLGDFNGDGVDDVSMGNMASSAMGQWINFAFPVRSEIVFGSSNGFPARVDLDVLDGTNGLYVVNSSGGGTVGMAAGCGDFDGDGVKDLMITRTSDGGQSGVHVLFGTEPRVVTNRLELSELDGDRIVFNATTQPWGWGRDAVIGDITGDGIADIVASDAYAATHVIFGLAQRPRPATAVGTSVEPENGFNFGVRPGGQAANNRAIGLIGDFNADGVDDFAVGGPRDHAVLGNPSRLYVVFGGSFAPEVVGLSPTNGAQGVALAASLRLTFDRLVAAGTGSITVRRMADGAVRDVVAVGSANVIIEDRTATVVLNRALDRGTAYEVEYGAGTFKAVLGESVEELPAGRWGFSTVSSSTVSLISSKNPSREGEPVTFTAGTFAGSGVGAGTVRFADGTNALGTVATDGAGLASVSVTNLGVGVHNIIATFESATSERASALLMPAQVVEPALGGTTGGTGGTGSGTGGSGPTNLAWTVVIKQPKASRPVVFSASKGIRSKGQVETDLGKGASVQVRLAVVPAGATNGSNAALVWADAASNGGRVGKVSKKGVAKWRGPKPLGGGLALEADQTVDVLAQAAQDFAVGTSPVARVEVTIKKVK